jgi:hypothetical protein
VRNGINGLVWMLSGIPQHAHHQTRPPRISRPSPPRQGSPHITHPQLSDHIWTQSPRRHPPTHHVFFLHDIFFIQRGVGHRWVSSHGSRLHHRHWDGVLRHASTLFPLSLTVIIYLSPEDLHTSIVVGSMVIWKHRWNDTMDDFRLGVWISDVVIFFFE